MQLDEIKKLVSLGKTVHWKDDAHRVVRDKEDKYQVVFLNNGEHVTHADLNYCFNIAGGGKDFSQSFAEKSLYEQMRDAGLIVGNHESDLYVLNRERTHKILEEHPSHKKNASSFISQTGEGHCLDIPFAYDPWWNKAEKTVENWAKTVSKPSL